MTPLENILSKYRSTSISEREKGSYFEELIRTYFRYEASYADLYSDVWLFADWARVVGTPQFGVSAKDTGVDLVAKTRGTEEYHAIQCKCFAPDYRVRKIDIDSFFTASGRKPFTQRIIVTTTNDWSVHAEDALLHQQPPVYKIDLHDLEKSQIEWAKYQPSAPPALKPKKTLRQHQVSACTNVMLGFESADRGKLIMACGTGKTFTSLKIAEESAGRGKLVIFLVPSLNLLSQTLTEWTQESVIPLHSFAVCSDAEVGKKRQADQDIVETFTHELRYPATTDANRLALEVKKRHDSQHMSVIFSTYHSLEVISRAQHLYGMEDVDLVICDEAHRTTGAVFNEADESTFTKIHDNEFIRAARRLYMTATPRIYADIAKATAERDSVALCSMDDEAIYGKQFHVITFSEAVELKLLTDYKVLVLTIDEAHVSARLQDLLKDESNQLKVDDAARIIGCWKALSKQGLTQDLNFDPDPMRRAVAFCQVIERQKGARNHKVSSKQIATMFKAVVDAYQAQEDSDNDLICEAAHVDGSMNASQKEEKLDWLKAEPPPNTCRILSNVRCLSEGVDVPALDAVLFLTPRNSQVDVVQSVGRVMRRTPDGKKQLGYVILPVVIPTGMEPHEALNDNKVYKVVWDVLQALRSHDDRFDAFVNKLDLIGKDPRKMEVIAITDKIERKDSKSKSPRTEPPSGQGEFTVGTQETRPQTDTQGELAFNVGELERALYAKVVKKCGNRNHWEDWANDIAKIAHTHITRITQIVTNPENICEVSAFNAFAAELRDDLNDSITDGEVIEMLAQHLITRPVFDALFKDYSFANHNPVSQAMQQVLDVLEEHRLEKEADTLEKFYASVRRKVEDIDSSEAKQKIVKELYDKFFQNAFPALARRLGIVYTPIEIVDFIIHSINDLLQSEFHQTLGSEGVHIIDPFTGTGTFITRLLQSGLIKREELPHKYKNEIHANEIVLLAYYIAAINIEAVYHSVVGGEYEPFQGICLTDTFQMYEKDDLVSDLMEHNSSRRKRQKKLDIRVIMANPPYSSGDKDDENNKKTSYPHLDGRISDTYVDASSNAMGKSKIYDSYIRAIRWASDRIGNAGVIGYVSGSAWIERSFADGMRKCLADEFSTLYIFHLRGDVRKNMLSRGTAGEGGNIFDSGNMTGVAITLFVKNPASPVRGQIYFHDIGSDLPSDEKRLLIRGFARVNGITQESSWIRIVPDEHHDWLEQRDNTLASGIIIGDKSEKHATKLFQSYSMGVKSNRDSWVYNYSRASLMRNMRDTILFFNSEAQRLAGAKEGKFVDLVDRNERKIKWTTDLIREAEHGVKHSLVASELRVAYYRPFCKCWSYFNSSWNWTRHLIPSYFPTADMKNLLICVSGVGARSGFSALITDSIPNLHILDTGQCFALYLYGKADGTGNDHLFGTCQASYNRRDSISDAGLLHFQEFFPDEVITKEDLFYYIYGLLHSPAYRMRNANNLRKELPRIPAVKTVADFRAFSQAGRDLAFWHLNYETVALHLGTTLDTGKLPGSALTDADYRVTRMKFAKARDPGTNKSINDKSAVIYNERITIRGIPPEAYEYVVNGKAALEWVMERQTVTTDKDSGIVNDANLWAAETVGNPKYPLELFLRMITVSLETMKIVSKLPPVDESS